MEGKGRVSVEKQLVCLHTLCIPIEDESYLQFYFHCRIATFGCQKYIAFTKDFIEDKMHTCFDAL